MRDIKNLHPRLQFMIDELVKRCNLSGLKIGIGECLRTKAEQDALYAKGRTVSGKIVTNAKGTTYSSMHQWGIAFDFYRNDGKGAFNNSDGFFEKVGEIGKSIGLFWGGDFKNPVDRPHFQLSDWGKTPQNLKSKYKVPEKFFESWENEEMTVEEKREFETLKNEVLSLKAKRERVFHNISEVPQYAKATIEKLTAKGILQGASEDDLNMNETLMRILVLNDRAGLY